MLPTTFQATFQWVLAHGYFLIFILMLVEGPVVTAAAAFAAALGYFNVWIIFILSILGNLIPDVIYYAMGYWGRHKFIDKYGRYLGITPERMETAERLAKHHTGKSLIAIKMIPFLATPGLIVVGATRMDIRKYVWWCVAITAPSSLIYLVLGYYFGTAYGTIDHYLHIGGYVIAAGVAVFLIILYLQRKYTEKLLKNIEK